MPTIINSPKVISSLSDKTMLFASNVMLKDIGHSLPNFPHVTEHTLSNIFFTSWKSQDSSKVLTLREPLTQTKSQHLSLRISTSTIPDLSKII